MNNSSPKIYPRCKMDMASTYVSAEGIVYPCCWLGNFPHNQSYKELHNGNLEPLSLLKRPLSQILADPVYKKVEQSWPTASFKACKSFCGDAISKSVETVDGTNDLIRIPVKLETDY